MIYLPVTREASESWSFVELVGWIYKKCSLEDLTKFFLITWSLWKHQIKMMYDRAGMEPKIAIDEAITYQSFFSLCRKTTKKEIK